MLKVADNAAKEYALVKTELRDRAEGEDTSKLREFSKKKGGKKERKRVPWRGRRPSIPVLDVGNKAILSGRAGKAKRGARNAVPRATEQRAPDPRGMATGRAEQRPKPMSNHLRWLCPERRLSKADPSLRLVELMRDRRPQQPEPLPNETLRFQWRPLHSPSESFEFLGSFPSSKWARSDYHPGESGFRVAAGAPRPIHSVEVCNGHKR